MSYISPNEGPKDGIFRTHTHTKKTLRQKGYSLSLKLTTKLLVVSCSRAQQFTGCVIQSCGSFINSDLWNTVWSQRGEKKTSNSEKTGQNRLAPFFGYQTKNRLQNWGYRFRVGILEWVGEGLSGLRRARPRRWGAGAEEAGAGLPVQGLHAAGEVAAAFMFPLQAQAQPY